jgi:hypothetical protein
LPLIKQFVFFEPQQQLVQFEFLQLKRDVVVQRRTFFQ